MAPSIRQRVTNSALGALSKTTRAIAAKMPPAVEVQPDVWISPGVDRSHAATFEGGNVISRGVSFQGRDIHVGRGTTIGIGCILSGPLSVGRFTQFGSYAGVYAADHPIDVAVPNVNDRFIGGLVGGQSVKEPVSIGHGCWIGHGAVILRGVTVGNGAVIGAGTVVRRDVPGYSTVTGVPAGAPRHRFDEDLAAALDDAAWWEWPDHLLAARRELFLTSFRDNPNLARRLLAEFPQSTEHQHVHPRP